MGTAESDEICMRQLYYAHLSRYADGIQEGQQVQPGTVLGYIGATGNASPHASHLYFVVWHVYDPRRFWRGIPINPYPLLRPTS